MKALIAQKREHMTEIIDLAVDRLAEFHATLTPEQREKLVAKLEYFHEKHKSRWN
jgi:Spy/CpxP family protein refolding chaperone